jgi:hypothetical protein
MAGRGAKWQNYTRDRAGNGITAMTGALPHHRQAALTYLGLGVVVILITFAAGLSPAGRANPFFEVGVGAVFIVIFAGLIYRGWWPISALLIFSNTWRVVTYFNDGLGRHMELLPFSITRTEPRPVAFVNAVLMAMIVFMLARSAWAGLLAWRARRPSSN